MRLLAVTGVVDAAGNRLTQTDARNVVVNYAHDALNRPISVDYSNNALDVTFAYDACVNGVGQLCSMTDDAGMTTWAYNRRGVVNKQTVTIDSPEKEKGARGPFFHHSTE